MTHPRHVQVSDLLADFSLYDRETITVQDLLDHFGERAFGALMLVFAAPLILPMPPGLSAVLGAPLVFITAQLMVGRHRLWLPRIVSQRSIRHRDFIAIADKVLPYLRKLENRLKPRMTWVLAPLAERLIGAVALVLAVIVFLPIPFGNMLPSLAIAVLGLGIVERDGLATLLGWLTAVASVAVLAFVSKALAAATVTFFTTLLAPF
jgi:hypothetical protein